jgi:hypothetical protein
MLEQYVAHNATKASTTIHLNKLLVEDGFFGSKSLYSLFHPLPLHLEQELPAKVPDP